MSDPEITTPEGDRLFLQVYDELRSLARRYLDAEQSPGSLQPTALVHEAYLRLAQIHSMRWSDRTHFFAMAATQMRRILVVERARAASARKRGSRPRRITLDSDLGPQDAGSPIEMLALDEALRRLHEKNARQARVAEMHVFAGMQTDEIAAVLSLSERTIKVPSRPPKRRRSTRSCAGSELRDRAPFAILWRRILTPLRPRPPAGADTYTVLRGTLGCRMESVPVVDWDTFGGRMKGNRCLSSAGEVYDCRGVVCRRAVSCDCVLATSSPVSAS